MCAVGIARRLLYQSSPVSTVPQEVQLLPSYFATNSLKFSTENWSCGVQVWLQSSRRGQREHDSMRPSEPSPISAGSCTVGHATEVVFLTLRRRLRKRRPTRVRNNPPPAINASTCIGMCKLPPRKTRTAVILTDVVIHTAFLPQGSVTNITEPGDH